MAGKQKKIPDELLPLVNAGIQIDDEDYTTNPEGRVITLGLSGKKISDLSPLATLTQITKLDLSNNQIQDIAPLKGLTQITRLYLSDNQIQDIAPLKALTLITTLDLSYNQIQDIAPLKALTLITKLFLSYSQIQNIEPLKELKLIATLYLNNNQIQDIAPLKALTQITELSLYNNQIKDIAPLKGLTLITKLYLSNNQIQDIAPLKGLKLITQLFLSNNQIQDIAPLKGLTLITELYLSNNQIQDIAPLKGLTKLVYGGIDNNPAADKIPASTLEEGWGAILKHISIQAADLAPINEVKVLLLGNSNVGKSDLLKYLSTGKLPEENKGSESTHGLVYKELTFENKDWKLHCWDFGGQEFYHATHQLFFSPGALHLLLWSHKDAPRKNAEQEVFFKLDYWLRCIEQLSKDTKNNKPTEALLIENKIDKEGYSSMLLQQPGIQKTIDGFKEKIRVHISSVSLLKNSRLQGLEEVIHELVPTLFEKHPPEYAKYLNFIKSSGEAVLTTEVIAPGIPQKDIDRAMGILHNIGCVLYFPGIIPGKVFAKPGELVDLLYKKILHDSKKYTITAAELEASIAGNTMGLTYEEVKGLLLDFHLVFSLLNEPDVFYIPQYLPAAPAWMDLMEQHHFRKVYMRIRSDSYLMHNALLRLFTQYAKNIKNGGGHELMFWKDGLVIERETNGKEILLIKLNREAQCIELYSDPEGKNYPFQQEVVDFIVNLPDESDTALRFGGKLRSEPENKEQGMGGERRIKPEDSSRFDVELSTDGVYFASLKTIKGNINKKIYHVTANTDNGAEKECSVFTFNKYLGNQQGRMRKIFISYSKDDLALVDTFIAHLAPLKLDGKVATWYCTDLKPGTDWNAEIKEHFDAADMVCFMVSYNFLNTPYILEYEIKAAIKRKEEDKNFLIVPIILDYCSWDAEVYKLSQYTALPYTAKEVVSFKNPNMAWYAITECLRMVIDENKQLEKQEDGDKYFQTAKKSKKLTEIFEAIKNRTA